MRQMLFKISLQKLLFLIYSRLTINVDLQKDDECERQKANNVYQIAQKICSLRQSWGEDVLVSFELNCE